MAVSVADVYRYENFINDQHCYLACLATGCALAVVGDGMWIVQFFRPPPRAEYRYNLEELAATDGPWQTGRRHVMFS